MWSEEFNAISPTERKYRDWQWDSVIVTGDNGCRLLLVVGGRTTLSCFFDDCGHDKHILLVTQWCYADKCIVNIIIKVYIERNNLQLELIRYSMKCLLYLLLRSADSPTDPTAGNHFCSVSDSLGGLSTASECMERTRMLQTDEERTPYSGARVRMFRNPHREYQKRGPGHGIGEARFPGRSHRPAEGRRSSLPHILAIMQSSRYHHKSPRRSGPS